MAVKLLHDWKILQVDSAESQLTSPMTQYVSALFGVANAKPATTPQRFRLVSYMITNLNKEARLLYFFNTRKTC